MPKKSKKPWLHYLVIEIIWYSLWWLLFFIFASRVFGRTYLSLIISLLITLINPLYSKYIQLKPFKSELYRLPGLKFEGTVIKKYLCSFPLTIISRESITAYNANNEQIKLYITESKMNGENSPRNIKIGDKGILYYRKGKKYNYFEEFVPESMKIEIESEKYKLANETINSLIELYHEGKELANNLYMIDNISSQMLGNAKINYASCCPKNETVIFLFDNTNSGSAEDGFLLTSRRLYSKSFLDSGEGVEISKICNLLFDKSQKLSFIAIQTNDEKHKKIILSSTALRTEKQELLYHILKKTIDLLRMELLEKREAAVNCNENSTGYYTDNEINSISPLITDDIRREITQICDREEWITNFYLFKEIPTGKLINAKKSYASQISENESVICLFDNTIYGSAKNGFLLTSKYLYYKMPLQKVIRIPLIQINSISFNGSDKYSTRVLVRHNDGLLILLYSNSITKTKDYSALYRLIKNIIYKIKMENEQNENNNA